MHTRSRRASLAGLVLQVVAALSVLALAGLSQSAGVRNAAWYILGGVPIWFITLLVFRQKELAEFEALDLEELRREKRRTGGGEALFGEEGGAGLGFRVAEARLRWMQRWLVPAVALATAAYLGVMGVLAWKILPSAPAAARGAAIYNVPLTMILIAVAMLLLFLFSRYFSGMGRVEAWQLLRGCGSYMLGNAVVLGALLVGLGALQYAGEASWERTVATAIPVLMVILALEIVLNFVADIYRPRVEGQEPRAAFDSRLLGLIAAPEGLARNIADAINYQFGFQVSQTWFYQFVQRAFLPLVWAFVLLLWLMTTVVIVEPYERAVIEHWGKLVSPDQPLEPGLHLKQPWPIERVHKYNTGQLHQIVVGFKEYDAAPKEEAAKKEVVLWTDQEHMGQPHFDFLIPPAPAPPRTEEAESSQRPTAGPAADSRSVAVHMVRMAVVVQYRIEADRLAQYAGTEANPEQVMRDLAWSEVVKTSASTTIDAMLGDELGAFGRKLREQMERRVRDADIGLKVVYVGLANIHPEKTASDAFRDVINAGQEKVRLIREALVSESERLSKVAGDRQKALALALAVDQTRASETALSESETVLRDAPPDVVRALTAKLEALAPQFAARAEARLRLEQARQRAVEVAQDFELGLGPTAADKRDAERAVADAGAAYDAAQNALSALLAPIWSEPGRELKPQLIEALIRNVDARIALPFWKERLEEQLRGLEGDAARLLAEAQAQRWKIEMAAAGDLAQIQNEREAFRRVPEIYKTRRLLEVLVEGMSDSRKFFLAFDQTGRRVHIRYNAEEEGRTGIENLPASVKP
jgi:regulator of protease activity HflC (stomatin/prohibitin superfamily)